MLNFRIIDGDYHIIPPETYENIKKDYMNSSLTINEILKKYDVSVNKWSKIRKQIKEETGVNRRDIGKNYHYSTREGKYIVTRMIEGHLKYYGFYFTEEEAKERVKELKANGWME